MISPWLMPKAVWRAKLHAQKFKPAKDISKDLKTAEWWITPWGFLFTVPCDNEGRCENFAFQKLMADISGSAPAGYKLEQDNTPAS